MPQIFVSPLSQVPRAVELVRPSHLITLLDPQTPVPTPEGILPDRHLRLGVHDIAYVRHDATAPEENHVANILAFIETWDQSAPMLVHCWAGVSRSTATAFAALCMFNDPGRELALARALRLRAPHAQPNKLIVAHADKLLGRKGRMIRAVEALGPAEIVFEGEVFGIPVRADALQD
ncbi:MAG: protein tyrosine phosphatase [Alphaproteobacteria bacterium]|nr:protein tyrosine phosphatase [Alphaproteobacteria bacterium]